LADCASGMSCLGMVEFGIKLQPHRGMNLN
jgi:hypothetical protein